MAVHYVNTRREIVERKRIFTSRKIARAEGKLVDNGPGRAWCTHFGDEIDDDSERDKRDNELLR